MSVPRAYGKLQLLGLFLSLGLWLNAGVRREVEDWYVQKYENKAMFLKVPIRGEQQMVYVRNTGPVLDRRTGNLSLLFKVGDQVRITKVDFKGGSIRFQIASVDLRRESEIIFQFPQQLREGFPQRASFDAALEATLTEGLSYTDIDSAKEKFIKTEFEQLVQHLARSSNTSIDFVFRTLAEKMPDYRLLKDEANEAKSGLQKVEQALREEMKTREQVQAQLGPLKRDLNRAETGLAGLRAERDELSEEVKSLRQQIDQLRSSSGGYEHQIKKLVENLNLKEASTESLGKQVQVLNNSINSLRQDRINFSRKLDDANKQLEDLKKRNEKLSEDLKQTQGEKERLWEDFRTLTSNRKGLEAGYIETKREKEALENTALLSSSLRLERKLEKLEQGAFQMAVLYLLTKRVGTFEIEVPEYPGKTYRVRFFVDSPDTVKFSAEERKLYEVLGEKFKIETTWQSSSDNLKMVLLNTEAIQDVGSREIVEWLWLFQGEISQPERVSLIAYLINSDGRKIFLGSQDFTLKPGELLVRLRHSISPVSLLAGAVLAIAVFGLVFGFGRRSHSSTQKAPRETPRDVVLQKKL
ncbi:hypothetical protein MYX75_13030 [Acidobacteria bacterium AH-259-A15]|nr:hypothetical protein [Acidobacteria bacterium AH-259-A15]